MKYQVAQHSLRGSRPTNQDRIAVAERDNAVLLVLADGLGGHSGGDLAAEALTQMAVRAFQAVRTPVIDRPSAFLALTILKAHDAIVARGKTHIPPLEPRTTCVLCLVQNGYAYWAHVGDSRLYHFRGNTLLRRTQDHTAIEELRRNGVLSEQEVMQHPFKNRLLECVGGRQTPTVSLGEETLIQPGDTLLLCSDGVWEALTQEQLRRYLSYELLDEGIEEMLLAIERKMKATCDNISAVGLRWEDGFVSTLPLQGNGAVAVDKRRLWKEAQQWSVGNKVNTKRGRSAVGGDRRDQIEQDIRELEEYIRRREPKPR